MMKKVFAIVALAAMFFAGKAQAQISVNVGYAPETFTTKFGNDSSTENYQGFFAGVTYIVPIVSGFGVAVGPQFRMNTKSTSVTILNITTSVKDTQMLIDVPVLFNYAIGVSRDFSIAPFVGPMFSYAVSGTTKTTVGTNANTSKWYGDNSGLNPFNINVVGGVSASYSMVKLFAGYRLGLMDQEKNSDIITLKTQGFFVGLGFDF